MRGTAGSNGPFAPDPLFTTFSAPHDALRGRDRPATVGRVANRGTREEAHRYERETLEFERVAFFSDAIFAIAMTLLVVGLDVPTIAEETSSRDLWNALGDMSSQILMFFVSFAVLGSFWLGHHRFFGRLARIDRRTATINLVYLALIAFLPFLSSVLGEYGDNSVAVALYASAIAGTAGMACGLNEVATRRHLYVRQPTALVLRWHRLFPLLPAVFFLATIGIAVVSPSGAIYSWILLYPLTTLLQSRMPDDVRYFFHDD